MLPFINLGFIKIPSYTLMLVVGVVSYATYLLVTLKKEGKSKQVIEKALLVSVLAFAVMGVTAFLFNSLFHSIEQGKLVMGGITWAGGVVGAFPAFVILTHFIIKEERGNEINFFSLLVPGIVLGHAFGRIGCFMDGCCYGITTGTFLDMYFPSIAKSVLPTQLYECIFLFALYYVMTKRDVHSLQIYCFGYGAFRFLIEFLRGDIARGEFVPGMSPAQFISILLVVTGIVLTIFWDKISTSSINRVDKVEEVQQ